jgi:hypothetical protein
LTNFYPARLAEWRFRFALTRFEIVCHPVPASLIYSGVPFMRKSIATFSLRSSGPEGSLFAVAVPGIRAVSEAILLEAGVLESILRDFCQ